MNTTDTVVNESTDNQNNEEQVIVETVQEQEPDTIEKPAAQTTIEETTPGFEAFLALVGVLGALYYTQK